MVQHHCPRAKKWEFAILTDQRTPFVLQLRILRPLAEQTVGVKVVLIILV